MQVQSIGEIRVLCDALSDLLIAVNDSAEIRKIGGLPPYTVSIVFGPDNKYDGNHAVQIKDKSGWEYLCYLDGHVLWFVFACSSCGAQVDCSEIKRDCEDCESRRAKDYEETVEQAYAAWRRS